MPVRIVYVSTLQPAITDEEIEAMVEKAAAFNKSQDITGILAFEGRRVCQILEGPAESVEALFASITRDPRHEGVVEIVRAPIGEVSFDGWGMVRRPMIDMVMAAFAD